MNESGKAFINQLQSLNWSGDLLEGFQINVRGFVVAQRPIPG
jgi:hypothetical protein